MLRFLFFLVVFLASLQLFAQVQLNRIAKQEQIAGLQVSVVQNGHEQVYSSGYSNV